MYDENNNFIDYDDYDDAKVTDDNDDDDVDEEEDDTDTDTDTEIDTDMNTDMMKDADTGQVTDTEYENRVRVVVRYNNNIIILRNIDKARDTMIEEIVKLNDQLLPQLQANVAELEEISKQGELNTASHHRLYELEQQRDTIEISRKQYSKDLDRITYGATSDKSTKGYFLANEHFERMRLKRKVEHEERHKQKQQQELEKREKKIRNEQQQLQQKLKEHMQVQAAQQKQEDEQRIAAIRNTAIRI